ncbi:hypothetical protein ABI066_16430, partial [Enterococcus faecium]|uniref:hypothetical protein n=1 Tax=Enterococcus faecium TaxID=1352 RepID=UPI003F42CBB5
IKATVAVAVDVMTTNPAISFPEDDARRQLRSTRQNLHLQVFVYECWSLNKTLQVGHAQG